MCADVTCASAAAHTCPKLAQQMLSDWAVDATSVAEMRADARLLRKKPRRRALCVALCGEDTTHHDS